MFPLRGKMRARLNILVGQRFGKFVVVSAEGVNARRRSMWRCRCDCGNEGVYTGTALKSKTRSCGCTRKHGLRHTAEYGVWQNMVRRCHNKRSAQYKDYGGRGIFVCDKWRKDFADFYGHVGPRPTPKHQIERIDNNRGYESGNVRWATAIEQQNNTRKNLLINFHGNSMTLAQAMRASRSSLSYTGVLKRLKQGWSAERALLAGRLK